LHAEPATGLYRNLSTFLEEDIGTTRDKRYSGRFPMENWCDKNLGSPAFTCFREMTMIKKRTGIILAVDTEDEASTLRIIRATANYIDAIKIGLPLILNTGPHIVRMIKEIGAIPLIADFKIMDVPFIAMKIVAAALDKGCDAVTICGQCGPTVLRECADYARAMDKGIIVFTEFTHPDGLIDSDTANQVALTARELNLYGIQAPGTQPERIARIREIVDFEIIGRAICDAQSPKLAVRNIQAQIAGHFKS
jgi:orotidine-5'-phosphate decarboxylase